MMMAESGGDPNVSNSAAGAQGIMQFMPDTAQQYAVNPSDPISSINGAAHYLGDLMKMFNGDDQKAVAAYNWGPGNVQDAVNQFGDRWFYVLPQETQDYVKKVLG